ncbi:hypothetical protein DL766_000827 [Monosporascus sp. MC13-8B]|uniref:Stress response RCI peptide n=1 Tax=Monosporascus cannonballus TaxID=155416 RepID=A0ABY0GXU2_9PEZI|nr:hypothetical protein DL762_009424 [Monosporascus cannonballus]RYO82715.1 hypothetical protein DL763_008170 [Monosporascus cannonballus]RYP38617.1 hypothetical protein DL766_000827 [Monosporascus sp. MC13-8B]
MCISDIFLGFLAILFPPLPVWVKRGLCSVDSLLNILLFTLGYVRHPYSPTHPFLSRVPTPRGAQLTRQQIPGLIHAWYIIAKFPDEEYEYEGLPQDAEGGRVTYIFVQSDGSRRQQQQQQQQPKPQHQGGMNYGTTNTGGVSSSSPAPPQQNGGEGSNNSHPPPTYAEAVKGDHKVQTQD